MSIVIVKNSLDKPFGVLANDAITPFTIGTQTYQSIVNYVYSNLLPDSTFKTELMHMHPDSGLLVAFRESKKHLKKSIIQSALHTAIIEKIKQSPKFLEKLLQTGSSKIFYNSPNKYLGTAQDGSGDNLYGQLLEQTRNEIQVEKTNVKQKNNIYLSYVAEINLKKALKKHNLEKYLSKDGKRSIKMLVDALVGDYGNTTVYSTVPDLETVLTLHEKRNILDYKDPNSLIRVVRKNEIRHVLKKNVFDLRIKALQAFIDYTINKNIISVDQQSRLKEQLFEIPISKREDFATRILQLYAAKALPEEVRTHIKNFKSQWYFPSEQEIQDFEAEHVKLPDLQPENTETFDSYTVQINDVLSPLDESAELTISKSGGSNVGEANRRSAVKQHFTFKSISQFVAFELFFLQSGSKDVQRSYAQIKNVKSADLDSFIRMFEQDLFKEKKNKLLADAINYKLQLLDIKTLVYLTKQIKIKDEFNLDNTTEVYQKYKEKIVLPIRQIHSFEQFVYRDSFMHTILKEKIDFYFMILQNLVVHAHSKSYFNVSVDDLVEMSPFYGHIMIQDSSIPNASFPSYLKEQQSKYNLSTKSLLQVWTIIFNSLKQSETIVGAHTYDIRYKGLFTWSKYLLGKKINHLKHFDIMQTHEENLFLTTTIAILSTLAHVNLKFDTITSKPFLDVNDLNTVFHLCLGKSRKNIYTKSTFDVSRFFGEETVPDERPTTPADLEIYEEHPIQLQAPAFVDDDLEDPENVNVEFGDDDQELGEEEFDGFNLEDRQRFDAFVEAYFGSHRVWLKVHDFDILVQKLLASNTASSVKRQNVNFFMSGFVVPSLN